MKEGRAQNGMTMWERINVEGKNGRRWKGRTMNELMNEVATPDLGRPKTLFACRRTIII